MNRGGLVGKRPRPTAALSLLGASWPLAHPRGLVSFLAPPAAKREGFPAAWPLRASDLSVLAPSPSPRSILGMILCPHTHTNTHTHIHAPVPALMCALAYNHSNPHTRTTHPLTCMHTLTTPLTLTCTHAHSHTHTRTLAHQDTRSYTRTHVSTTLSHAHNLPSPTCSHLSHFQTPWGWRGVGLQI